MEYVEKCFVPCFGTDVIVVWDSGAVHKSKLVIKVLKECGVEVICLSPYLPDLSPIELGTVQK